MQFRVVTLNLEQDHKRWSDRHPLISAEIAGLRPDVIALNEVCVPLQTARLLRDSAIAATGIPYKLVQQTRVNGLSKVEGEALLTRFAIVETGNLDYQTRDIVALVARVVIEERSVDLYVTHLYMSRGDDSLRLFQVQQLLQWIDSRADGTPAIVCGDFNATLDASSAGLMATRFRPTQTMPTAFTPLADGNGAVSHPDRPADGPLHRLHLDFGRHRDPRERGLLQSPEPGRSVAVAVRPCRCLGRPADMRKCFPNFAWGYGVTR
jgi:endonuclease/exonuclease/phosphatase family metal-dependent hydrolase